MKTREHLSLDGVPATQVPEHIKRYIGERGKMVMTSNTAYQIGSVIAADHVYGSAIAGSYAFGVPHAVIAKASEEDWASCLRDLGARYYRSYGFLYWISFD